MVRVLQNETSPLPCGSSFVTASCLLLAWGACLAASAANSDSLCEALECSGLSWNTNGVAWFYQTNVSYDGVDAAEAGFEAGNLNASLIGTTVQGPSTLAFKWRTITVAGRSYAAFAASNITRTLGGDSGWQAETVYLPSGVQTVQWALNRACCTASESDKAWLDQLTITPGGTPAFISQAPTNGVAASGGTFTFSVSASGTPPFRYQWYFGINRLVSATNGSLVLTGLQTTAAGTYRVVVSNDFGFAEAAARLGFEAKPSLSWAVAPANPGTGSSAGNAIAVAPNGDCYVAGLGYSAVALDNLPGGPGFVARLNPQGIVQWVQPCGTNALGVAVGPDGFVYVSGRTSGSDWFGEAHPPATTNSLFLAKFDPTYGNNVWVRFCAHLGSYPEGPVVAVSPQNEVYIAGNTWRTSEFGPTNFYVRADNPFVAKYDANGNFGWVRANGATNYPGGVLGITTDPAGNVFVTGYTGVPADLEGFRISSYSCCGYNAMFLLKYSPAADPTLVGYWSNYYEERNADFDGRAVAVDQSGRAFVALSAFDTFLDGFSSQINMYIYPPSCCVTCTFCRTTVSSTRSLKSSDYARALAADPDGNTFMTGDFSGAVVFGGNSATRLETANTNTPLSDAFLARFKPSGECMWTEKLSGFGKDGARGVAVGTDGSVYMTGFFETNATIRNTTLTSAAPSTWFVARFAGTQPVIQDLNYSADGFTFSFQTQTGVSYLVESKIDLTSSNWGAVTNIIGNGAARTINDNAPGLLRRFYRLRVP